MLGYVHVAHTAWTFLSCDGEPEAPLVGSQGGFLVPGRRRPGRSGTQGEGDLLGREHAQDRGDGCRERCATKRASQRPATAGAIIGYLGRSGPRTRLYPVAYQMPGYTGYKG